MTTVPVGIEEAVSKLSVRLSGKPPEVAPAEKVEPVAVETAEQQPAAESGMADDAVAPSDESADAVVDDSEIDLPDSLDGLAEALGVDPSKLTGLKVKRTVNGKVEEVSLSEAIEQHQLHADYTRKTTELAEQRKAIDAERARIKTDAVAKIQQLDDAITASWAVVEKSGLSDEALEQIERTQGFEARLKAERKRDAMIADAQEAIRKRHEAVQAHQEQERAGIEQYRKAQVEALHASTPELKDQKKMLEFEQNLVSYLPNYGFSQKEVVDWMTGPWDARFVNVIQKAMKYDDLMAKTKTAKGKPEVLKPATTLKPGGAAKADAKVTTENKLRTRLVESRNNGQRQAQVDAAAGLLRHRIRSR